MDLYGAPAAWTDRPASYRGMLPFDGVSIVNAIRSSGIALCLHRAEHRKANCPSMQLFEAAAAGALIITDDFDFPRVWFRDSVLYVDAELPPSIIIQQIMSHVEWANRNSDAANRLAQRSNELFRRSFTLESMLSTLPEFIEKVRERRSMVLNVGSAEQCQPTVEFIIRVGSRPAEMVARALDSLAAQIHPAIAVTIIQFHPVAGLEALLERYQQYRPA